MNIYQCFFGFSFGHVCCLTFYTSNSSLPKWADVLSLEGGQIGDGYVV
jgi:hypothetical protein